MPGAEAQVAEVYLHPGEFHFAPKPTVISTILGSCVGVTFWSKKFGIGGLCHAQLPHCPPSSMANLGQVGRYVDSAIRELARNFDRVGVPRAEVQVKVFGGGDVLMLDEGPFSKPTVGNLNCDAAMETLLAEGFQVLTSSVRGNSGLKIHFNTINGEVRLRRLNTQG